MANFKIGRDGLMSHVRALSDDRFEGRDSPSAGLDSAAIYIEGVAREMGLIGPNKGAADPFLQPFELYGFQPLDQFRLSYRPRYDALNPRIYGTRLFEYAVHDIEYARRMRNAGFAPRSLYRWGAVNNVVAALEGSDPALKDEYVLVSAHYDHLGTRKFGDDRIYNGADDNASGAALLLGLLPALAKMKKEGKGPRRSIIFIWTAAEEKGLVGADYFKERPLVPLDKTKAAINADMVARLSSDQISVCTRDSDGQESFLRELADKAGVAAGFRAVRHDVDEYQDLQDGKIWSDAGITTLFMFEGFTLDGRLNPDYHGADDEFDRIERDNWGLKLERSANFALSILLSAADR